MTRGKKTGGRDFEPGESGNPNGRPVMPLEFREFRTAAKKDIIEELKFLWNLPQLDLEEILEQENEVPAIRKALARAILMGVYSGDMKQINYILDRVIGKVKEEIDHNVKGNIHVQLVDLINNLEGKDNDDGDKETSEEDGET